MSSSSSRWTSARSTKSPSAGTCRRRSCSYLPAKSLLCRFCRDYSDHVTISIKARIGDGHHYRVEELNTLIDKLLLVAEDAEAMPATGWEPPSVRLY